MTRSGDPTRRRVLASLGSGAVLLAAGCTGLDGDPSYEEGTVGDLNESNRSAEEMTAAEALAEQEGSDEVTPLDALTIVEHEFVVEDGFTGATVQGTVQNTGGERIERVELRARVYDDGGNQLGRYLASTGDLDGGDSWSFQVVVLEDPADVASYDVTVLGTPT